MSSSAVKARQNKASTRSKANSTSSHDAIPLDPIKIVVVGDGAVGKTSLLNAFVYRTFLKDYEPTVFETMTHSIKLYKAQDSEPVEVPLKLWDTGGQEDFENIRVLNYPGDVILLCYGLDNIESLQNIADIWVPELMRYSPGSPIIMVGCKSDKRGELTEVYAAERSATSTAEAPSRNQNQSIPLVDNALVNQMRVTAKAYCNIECSAKTGANVDSVFQMASEAGLEYLRKKSKKSKRKSSISSAKQRAGLCSCFSSSKYAASN